MRILVVDPDPVSRRRTVKALAATGHAVDQASTAARASEALSSVAYDAIVLDVDLPDEDGEATIEAWRRHGLSVPILATSHRCTPQDRIATLTAGADDHIDQPLHTGELAARLEAVLRRRRETPVASIGVGDLTIDRTFREARCHGQRLPLTPRELALVEYLALHRGRVVSRSMIAEHVWDDSYTARSNVIDVLVARIRRKLEAAGSRASLSTVRGAGYALIAGTEASLSKRSAAAGVGSRPEARLASTG